MAYDFERPVLELENELERIRTAVEAGDLARMSEVERLERKLERVRNDVYGSLNAHQRVLLSRHNDRPFTLDYVSRLVTGFLELRGDRVFGDDPAIVAGVGTFMGTSVAVVGHQRGRSTQERITRNFGMARPEGNRKAQRIFKLAERFNLPLLLFVDTPGAFPGLEAEERGQAESIAKSLYLLSGLKVPIISIVIGEGGSGGALALGICDRLLMMENSTYSVITAEGCAAILWGKEEGASAENVKTAAENLKVTARALADTGIVDEVIKEPVGGAHREHDQAAERVGASLSKHLADLLNLPIDELLAQRYKKFRDFGVPQ